MLNPILAAHGLYKDEFFDIELVGTSSLPSQAAVHKARYLVSTMEAPIFIQLPQIAVPVGFKFKVKDIIGKCGTNKVVIDRGAFADNLIFGQADNYDFDSNYCQGLVEFVGGASRWVVS